ncbi:hypothetical protein GCM10010252_43450 [Streptomyces aureoverticillatus]|nr:hypothetical protein GCM10010252_43450 [Streptomyces aureoverticillatus]
MPRPGERRGHPWVPTALAAVLLVVLQCFGPSPTAHATAPTGEPVAYTACGDQGGAEAAPEHMRVRARPHACPVTDGHVTPAVPVAQDVPAAPCRPRVVAYDESRPAGSELPPLLQVFRC